MDLGTRKKALNALINVEHLEADKKLLQAKKPHSHVFKRKYPTPERTHREVLWDLLCIVNKEAIENNRKASAESNDETDLSAEALAKAEEEKRKAAELKAQQEKEAAERKVKEEEEKKAKEEAEKKAKKIEASKAELLAMDLDNKPNYKRMVSIVSVLNIETEGKKAKALITALKAFKATLLSSEEKEELENENEELKDQLDETQGQLEETQDKLEQKETELEETKKNSPQN